MSRRYSPDMLMFMEPADRRTIFAIRVSGAIFSPASAPAF